MSEEREQDAAVIAEFLALLAATDNQVDMFDAALLRELDRLTAERDQAREQLTKLRAACDGTPWLLETARERDGSSWDYPWPEVYDDAAARIRAALKSEDGE